jgi:DNA-binding NtrC family response regulator
MTILRLSSEPVVRAVLRQVMEDAGYAVETTGHLAAARAARARRGTIVACTNDNRTATSRKAPQDNCPIRGCRHRR